MTHDPDTSLLGRTPGLAEEHFAHDGLITKHAVRAVALAALRPMPGQLLWDLGTGAGSIAVEWCRTDPVGRSGWNARLSGPPTHVLTRPNSPFRASST